MDMDWGQDTIQRQLSGAVRNDAGSVQTVEELGRQGFWRTVQQCQAKLKALRKKYKEINGQGKEKRSE